MERSLGEHARRTLRKQLRRVRTGGEAALEERRDEELHPLRVALKRLRYNVEFFRCLLGGEAKDALELLALGQEKLGTISDDDAFSRTYERLLSELPADDPRRAGLEARVRAVRQERAAEIEALRALWRGGDEDPYPDRLAACISEALGSLSNEDS